MTEMLVDFGHGPIPFRTETWEAAVDLLAQMLSALSALRPVSCRLEEIGDDWLSRYQATQKSTEELETDPN